MIVDEPPGESWLWDYHHVISIRPHHNPNGSCRVLIIEQALNGKKMVVALLGR